MKLLLCSMTAALGLLASGVASGHQIRDNGAGYVIANGGISATPASNGVYRLYGTVGQAGVGLSQNTTWRLCSGFWCFGGTRVVSVNPAGRPIPAEFALGSAWPNPTRDQARFHLSLPKAANVTLTIFDVTGRQQDQISNALDAGEHELVLQAPNAKTGVYYVKVATDGRLRAKRAFVVVR